MLVQIRHITTGTLIKQQQISDDSGSVQQYELARRLNLLHTFADEGTFAVVLDIPTGDVIRKFEL